MQDDEPIFGRDDAVDFARQIEIMCRLSTLMSAKDKDGSLIAASIDELKQAFCADVYAQLQTCLATMLFTSCPFCYEGVARLQALAERLMHYATSIDDYGGSARSSGASALDYRQTIVYRFAEHMWKYDSAPDHQGYRSEHASWALCSVAAHSNLLDKCDEKLDALRSAVSTLISDREKTRIDYVDKIVCDSLVTNSAVLAASMTGALVEHAVNRDVDWCVLLCRRASELGNIRALPDFLRAVPLYISAVVRICGGSAALDRLVRTIVVASLSTLISGAYDGKVGAEGAHCAMDTGRSSMPCVFRRHKEDMLYLSTCVTQPIYACSASAHDKRMIPCCASASNGASARRESVFDTMKMIDEQRADEALRLRRRAEQTRKRGRAASSSSSRPVESEHTETMSVDKGDENLPLFGGPIVGCDVREAMKRSRVTLSPRQFLCVLLRTVHEVHARAGDTVRVRGPFYRVVDKGERQIVASMGSGRLSAYLDSLTNRRRMRNLSACKFSAMVRAPVPLGHVYETREQKRDSELDAFFVSCGLVNTSDDTVPRDAVSRALFRVGEVNAEGIFESTYARDYDNSLPLWLVSTDFSGDYRTWPWKVQISPSMSYTPMCYLRVREHRHCEYRRTRVRYTTRVSLDSGQDDVFYADLEEIAYRLVMGENKYEDLIERIYAYLLSSACLGVTSTTNKRLFVVHREEGGGHGVYSARALNYSDPRMPVFDMRLRDRVQLLMRNSSRRENGGIKTRTKLYTKKKFDPRPVRRRRYRETRRHMKEITLRAMSLFVRVDDIKNGAPECLSAPELAEMERQVRAADKEMVTLSLRLSKVVSVVRLDEEMPGAYKHCCLLIPTTSKSSFYGVVGSLHYMAARALGLSVDRWGYCPRRVLRMNRYSPDLTSVAPKALTVEAALEWMHSVVERRPLDCRRFVGRHLHSESPRYFTPRDCIGWMCRPESLRATLRSVNDWRRCVSEELGALRTAVAECAPSLYDMRAAYQDRSPGSAKWTRVSEAIATVRARDDAQRREQGQDRRADEVRAVPRRLLDGDYLWDPDTTPDPEWLLHFYLPSVQQAFDACAAMLEGVLNDDKHAWRDLFEFTHGRRCTERYVQEIDSAILRAYRTYWRRMCKDALDAVSAARARLGAE